MSKEVPKKARPSNPHLDAFQAMVEWFVRRYEAISRPESKAPRPNVVVVVGAGTSLWSGLPLWNEPLKIKVLNSIRGAQDALEFIEQCWSHLRKEVGLRPKEAPPGKHLHEYLQDQLIKRASIEDIASLATHFWGNEKRVHDLLASAMAPTQGGGIDSAGIPPQLGYELLAHLMKHGFVDHILTFNFDELLDEALMNELGEGEYTTVASDHDIEHESLQTGPHLVKLHGTISRRLTLRFTRAAVSSMSDQMVALLDNLVITPGPNVIVSLGYSWSDLDLLQWIQARHENLSEIVALVKDRSDIDKVEKRLSSTYVDKGVAPIFRGIAIDDLCKEVESSYRTIDLVMWAAWREVEASLMGLGRRRHKQLSSLATMPASRHILLGYLFGPNHGNPAATFNSHTRGRRLLAELFLHIIKCKGMINASVMAADKRIHRYYAAFAEKMQKDGDGDVLERVSSPFFLNNQNSAKRLSPGAIRRSSHADVKETYYSTAKSLDELYGLFSGKHCFVLQPPVVPNVTRDGIEQLDCEGIDLVRDEVQKIFYGPEVEVSRRPDPSSSWKFSGARSIETYAELQARTRLLLEADWTHLLVIAESGAWLTQQGVLDLIASKSSCRILLLEARQPEETQWPLRRGIEKDLAKSWTRLHQSTINVYRGQLSWWQHNRHLTLALDLSEKLNCLGGIFFRRPMKTSVISPVYLDGAHASDTQELILTFMSYARRALREIEAAPTFATDSRAIEPFRVQALEVATKAKSMGLDNSRLSQLIDHGLQWSIRPPWLAPPNDALSRGIMEVLE